eukprot:CAMPEP_0174739456 /NCGR_PEP_ID=MMETSP1094-20130205/71648_1 /TAXON_ID=156173 /ORGANISM="Chrysochromulina brevifilum, Strain UTEX LB 985" /LENGTH=134 /DNA_ID=CAMNT_0015943019 /DNA_START=11 /DNA_END=415 /DNA_ORIENTATION=+
MVRDDAGTRASRLARFDTRHFTLHEHCGIVVAQLQKCLQTHGISSVDPVEQDEENWQRAQPCRAMWIDYQRCGSHFMYSLDLASTSCKEQADALKRCSQKPGTDCITFELAVLECTAAVIKSQMAASDAQKKST